LHETRQPSATRSAFSGLCTLLAVGLLIGASLSGTEPAVDLSGSGSQQRHAVRHMTQKVARAVRSLMGERTKPGMPATAARKDSERLPNRGTLAGRQRCSIAIEPLRDELVSLPPPGARG
jgi:hypothetical protein